METNCCGRRVAVLCFSGVYAWRARHCMAKLDIRPNVGLWLNSQTSSQVSDTMPLTSPFVTRGIKRIFPRFSFRSHNSVKMFFGRTLRNKRNVDNYVLWKAGGCSGRADEVIKTNMMDRSISAFLGIVLLPFHSPSDEKLHPVFLRAQQI